MVKFLKNYFHHNDKRGSIRGLVNFGQWEELNLIESETGVVRGNHYHSNTDELFVILDGKIKVCLQKVENDSLVGPVKEFLVEKGDVFLVEKNTNHSFEILEKSRWINMLSTRTCNENPDILRTKK